MRSERDIGAHRGSCGAWSGRLGCRLEIILRRIDEMKGPTSGESNPRPEGSSDDWKQVVRDTDGGDLPLTMPSYRRGRH